MDERQSFEDLFGNDEPGRGAYLSRLFGLFSEEVVRHWCTMPAASYEDLGRPTLFADGSRHTLDFTLRSRTSGLTFVSEMKCELQFEGYRYLRLVSPQQVAHHIGAANAFPKFLSAARDPRSQEVRVGGKPMQVDGAILVWGATSPEGRRTVMSEFGLSDVLSVEKMIDDLRAWKPSEWTERMNTLRRWSNELFDGLTPDP